MAKEKNYEQLAVRLLKASDMDIIDFLEDKPKAYIVKLALRRFMNESENVLTETPTKTTENKPEGDSVLGW
jgi:hypothetical protein